MYSILFILTEYFLIHCNEFLCLFDIFEIGVEITCSESKSSGEQIAFMIKKFMEFRDEEIKKMENDSNLELGDVTTVNMTILNGDNRPSANGTPFKAVFDIRISVTLDTEKFEKQVIYLFNNKKFFLQYF